MKDNTEVLISVLAISNNDEEVILSFVNDVMKHLVKNFKNYEFIIIDNGSIDNTFEKAASLVKKYKNFRVLKLAQKYDREISYSAALENSIGDYVVVLDICTDPPEIIKHLVEKCSSGFDFVAGEPKGNKVPLFYKMLSFLFHLFTSLLFSTNSKNAWADTICISRKSVNSIIKNHDRIKYLKYLNDQVSTKKSIHEYVPVERCRYRSRFNYFQRIILGIEVIFANKSQFLHLASLISLLVSILNFGYIFYVLSFYIFKEDTTPGWTSTSLVFALTFGSLFFILFIFGEYITIIYKESKKGPLYHIVQDVESSDVLINDDIKNIV